VKRFLLALACLAASVGCAPDSAPSPEEIQAARQSDPYLRNIDRAKGVAEDANGRMTPLREEVDEVASVRDEVMRRSGQ